jgi:hypothetical protein
VQHEACMPVRLSYELMRAWIAWCQSPPKREYVSKRNRTGPSLRRWARQFMSMSNDDEQLATVTATAKEDWQPYRAALETIPERMATVIKNARRLMATRPIQRNGSEEQ